MRGRPRQADIARRAGVSQATVSMVINAGSEGHARISQETAERVRQAIRELGYVANPAARSLAGGRVGLLGVYTFEQVFPVDSHDFYYPFLLGIEEAAQASNVDLVLFTSATGPDGRRTIYRSGINHLAVADGCLMLGHPTDRDELAELARSGFPVVFLGRRELEGTEVSYVGADYAGATAEVVRILHELGHERMVCLAWADSDEPTSDRIRGYVVARAASASEVYRLDDGDINPALLRSLLDEQVTAVVVQDAVFAERLRAAAEEMGLAVPDDLSVAVLGDPPRGRTVTDWSGFTIPRREIGARAMSMLVEMVNEKVDEPMQALLSCQPHQGTTVAEPAAR